MELVTHRGDGVQVGADGHPLPGPHLSLPNSVFRDGWAGGSWFLSPCQAQVRPRPCPPQPRPSCQTYVHGTRPVNTVGSSWSGGAPRGSWAPARLAMTLPGPAPPLGSGHVF